MRGPVLHRTRPPKLPWAAARVIKACPSLTAAQKLIWMEILGLDQGGEEGAYMGATELAARLGMGIKYVENQRRELVAMGLLVTRKPEGRRTASWYAVLPPDCLPHSLRPTPKEIAECVEALEWALKHRDEFGGEDDGEDDGGVPTSVRPTTPKGPVADRAPMPTGPAEGANRSGDDPATHHAEGASSTGCDTHPGGAGCAEGSHPGGAGLGPTGPSGVVSIEDGVGMEGCTPAGLHPQPGRETPPSSEDGALLRAGGEEGGRVIAVEAFGRDWRSKLSAPAKLGTVLPAALGSFDASGGAQQATG